MSYQTELGSLKPDPSIESSYPKVIEYSNQMKVEQGQVTTGDDPTKAVLSDSGLNSKYLCDYVVNVATGCRHGCKFCYVPSTPNIRTRPDMLEEEADVKNPQKEWGSYVLYRDNLGEELDDHLDRKRTWNNTDRGCGIVGISFSTDCYMDGRAGGITREVVKALVNHNHFARILTRNPILALQDADVYQSAGENVTVGSSVPNLNESEVLAIEPRAPSPSHRLRGLRKMNELGIQTYVSMSPTYPTQNKSDIRGLMEEIGKVNPSVVFHEPINPRAANFEMTIDAAREADETDLIRELVDLRDYEYWMRYAVTHFKWVQELGDEMDLPVHLWPDKRLTKLAHPTIADWLSKWRNCQSPEKFAGRDTDERSPPPIPTGSIQNLLVTK